MARAAGILLNLDSVQLAGLLPATGDNSNCTVHLRDTDGVSKVCQAAIFVAVLVIPATKKSLNRVVIARVDRSQTHTSIDHVTRSNLLSRDKPVFTL